MSEVEKYEWIETREEYGEWPATVEFSPADNETDICERARCEKRSADGGESEVMSESENRFNETADNEDEWRETCEACLWSECRTKDIPPKRGPEESKEVLSHERVYTMSAEVEKCEVSDEWTGVNESIRKVMTRERRLGQ